MLCVVACSNAKTSLIPGNYINTSVSGLDLQKNKSPSIRNRNPMIPLPLPFCHLPLALHRGTEFAACQSTLSLFRELSDERLYYTYPESFKNEDVFPPFAFQLHLNGVFRYQKRRFSNFFSQNLELF